MTRTHGRTKREPTSDLLELVAGRFRALAEPTRLAILHALADGERTVTELVETTALGQGNLSKHLQQLHTCGFVNRRREGLFVYYSLADKDVLELCEIMCNRLEHDIEGSRKIVVGR
ncbi:MAG: winged helix-turn-helix transcriptional regulator [Gemmatimonadaceae bacterium]|nr:winged helix-turn-helix transcriptional regulator [Gemmatimonadaceae bacterium]